MDKVNDEPEEISKKKYEWLSKNKPKYGSSCHGANFVNFLKNLNYKTIIDVGTGHGEMCTRLSPYYDHVYGLDWVMSPTKEVEETKNITFFKNSATEIPLPDKSVDILISFDFFEHITPSNINKVLTEMKRVTKYAMVHKPCFENPSGTCKAKLEKVFGDGELHLTRENKNFWWNLFKAKSEQVYRIENAFYILI